ncbi:MAG TPA: SufE family protein [Candidatus Poseidoniales archaeon]|jgi:cysteine desulfuration protein SufE|nr:MAG: cysteine desulfuration protein SufE [Euryarchaeota archaeon]HIF16934.1 SufE family protein [Candidatus Poseidoniales archaeon]
MATTEWPEKLLEIIEDFSAAFDTSERYEMLFELADDVDELPISEWTPSTKVHGCQSEAHVLACLNEDGTFHLRGAADSKLVQGLISITAIALEGLSLAEVAIFSPTYVEEMGLKEALSPSRANGFLNMFKKVQQEAALLGE